MMDPAWPVALDVGLKLLAVLALIYATAAALKRLLPGAPRAAHSTLHMLDATSLGPRRAIYVVEVGGRVLVVGATDTMVTTLTEFTDPAEVSQIVSAARPAWPPFQRQLELVLGRAAKSQDSTAAPRPGVISWPRPATLLRLAQGPGRASRERQPSRREER